MWTGWPQRTSNYYWSHHGHTSWLGPNHKLRSSVDGFPGSLSLLLLRLPVLLWLWLSPPSSLVSNVLVTRDCSWDGFGAFVRLVKK